MSNTKLEILEIYAQNIEKPDEKIVQKMATIINLINSDLEGHLAEAKVGHANFNLMRYYLSGIQNKLKI